MSVDEEDLLRRTADRDREAFGELYDRLSPRVFGLLVKILGQGGDAEDALQETFLQVWRNADTFDPNRAEPVAWILMIGRSRALDALRRRRRSAPDPVEAEPSQDEDPSQGLQREEQQSTVTSALQQLSADRRRVIELAFFGGLNHREIADRTGVPLGTVKSRIRLAMTELRDRMQIEEPSRHD